MVLIAPRIIEDDSDPSGGRLEVSFPPESGCETFSVPLTPTEEILQKWSVYVASFPFSYACHQCLSTCVLQN